MQSMSSYLKDTVLCLSCGAKSAMEMKSKQSSMSQEARTSKQKRAGNESGERPKAQTSGVQVTQLPQKPQKEVTPGSSYPRFLESDWEITPQEFSCYFARYCHITSPGEYLSGEKARQFFLQTNIPLPDLSHIWELSDINRDGCLDAAEFAVAMHLVQRYLQGFSLPPALPLPLSDCYHVSLKPHLPAATEKHVFKCKRIFEAFRQDLTRGILSGESARRLLAKSNLTKDQLRHIWALSDQDEDECFTFIEFTVAMHLVFVSKLGYILPVTLDPYSIFPPMVIKILQDLTQSDEDSLFSSSGSLSRQSNTPFSPDNSLFSLPKLPGAYHKHSGAFQEKSSTNPFQSAAISSVGQDFSKMSYDFPLPPQSEADVHADSPAYANLNYHPQDYTHAYSNDQIAFEHQVRSKTRDGKSHTGMDYSNSHVNHSTPHISIRTGHGLSGNSESNAKQQPQKYQINIGPGHEFSNSSHDQHHQTYQVSVGTGQVAPSPRTGHNMSDISDSITGHYLSNSEVGHKFSGQVAPSPKTEHISDFRTGHDMPNFSGSETRHKKFEYSGQVAPSPRTGYISDFRTEHDFSNFRQVAPSPRIEHEFSDSRTGHETPSSEAGHNISGYSNHMNSGNHQQLLQVSTGTEPTLPFPLYSSSEDSLEYARASKLSMIPEEDDETYELGQRSPSSHTKSHDSLHRSHASPSPDPHPQYRSHDYHGVTSHDDIAGKGFPPYDQYESQQDSCGGEMPWYQTTPSQDEWQTTPAYCPEKAAWLDNAARPSVQNKAHFANHALKFVVKEEVVPVLQVAQPVAIVEEGSSPSNREQLSSNVKKTISTAGLDGAKVKPTNAETGVDSNHTQSRGAVEWYEESVESLLRGKVQEARDFLDGVQVLENLEAEMLSFSQEDPTVGENLQDQEKRGVAKRSHDQKDVGMVAYSHDNQKSTGTAQKSHDGDNKSQNGKGSSRTSTKKSHDHKDLHHQKSHDQRQKTADISNGPTQSTSERSHFNLTLHETLNQSPDIIISPPPEETRKPFTILEGSHKGSSHSSGRALGNRRRKEQLNKAKMDELDSLFAGELASINQVFQEFEVKDKKKEIRAKTEEEDLKQVHSQDVVNLHALTLETFEEVSKRRSIQSENIEHQWEEEMQALERERLEALEQQQTQEDADDSLLKDLDNQLKTLIQTKEQEVKETQKIAQQNKILKEQQEKEERERKEREKQERLERLARAKDNPVLADEDVELTVEEWIAWMEDKKKQGMTPAQQEEYERRKKAYQEKRRAREEKLRQEEEEKRQKTMERIQSEMQSYSQRQKEIQESRLTEDELHRIQEEHARRQQEEARLRKEHGEKMRREDREREIEDLKPKARSALAARWEESVKSRTNGKPQSRDEHKATVITGKKSPEFQIDKEEERLERRISGSFLLSKTPTSPEKRNSVQ